MPKLAQCPSCAMVYELPENPQTPTEKEMHITGICSDECWDQLTLFNENEESEDEY